VYEVQEGRDEQIGIVFHYRNLTLEIAFGVLSPFCMFR